MKRVHVWLATAVMALSAAHAADAPRTRQLEANGKPPPATIADIAWLQGHWRGTALGGDTEEMWMPPQHGVMLGMYRLIRNGAPVFYELLTMSEEQGSLVLNLKHFEPNLTSWEEKAESRRFKLVAKEPGIMYFEGMTFIRSSDDTVTVYVAIQRGEQVTEERFDYRRVKTRG
jgi:hypothetical protein